MSGCKVQIAVFWFMTSIAIAGFARLTAIWPVNEPPRTWCQHEADLIALKILAFLAAPMLLLILVDVLWRKLAR